MTARRAASNAELVKTVEAIFAEGQGVWRIEVYPAELLPFYVSCSMLGQEHAARVVRWFADTANAIAASPRLCLTCDAVFATDKEWPAAICILVPDVPDVKNMLVQAICPRCHADQAGLFPAIHAAMDRWLGLKVRVIVPNAESGHA